MGMADYLSRFSSAAAPLTSHYDESFTVAKKNDKRCSET